MIIKINMRYKIYSILFFVSLLFFIVLILSFILYVISKASCNNNIDSNISSFNNCSIKNNSLLSIIISAILFIFFVILYLLDIDTKILKKCKIINVDIPETN